MLVQNRDEYHCHNMIQTNLAVETRHLCPLSDLFLALMIEQLIGMLLLEQLLDAIGVEELEVLQVGHLGHAGA